MVFGDTETHSALRQQNDRRSALLHLAQNLSDFIHLLYRKNGLIYSSNGYKVALILLKFNWKKRKKLRHVTHPYVTNKPVIWELN